MRAAWFAQRILKSGDRKRTLSAMPLSADTNSPSGSSCPAAGAASFTGWTLVLLMIGNEHSAVLEVSFYQNWAVLPTLSAHTTKHAGFRFYNINIINGLPMSTPGVDKGVMHKTQLFDGVLH